MARLATLIPPDAIDLSIGQPDLETPPHIVEAGIDALRGGWTKYTPRVGLTSLREVVREKLASVNGYRPRLEDIIVTGGG